MTPRYIRIQKIFFECIIQSIFQNCFHPSPSSASAACFGVSWIRFHSIPQAASMSFRSFHKFFKRPPLDRFGQSHVQQEGAGTGGADAVVGHRWPREVSGGG